MAAAIQDCTGSWIGVVDGNFMTININTVNTGKIVSWYNIIDGERFFDSVVISEVGISLKDKDYDIIVKLASANNIMVGKVKIGNCNTIPAIFGRI